MKDTEILRCGMTVKEYREYMTNPENSYRCQNCPENRGKKNHSQLKLACGEYRCEIAIGTGKERF